MSLISVVNLTFTYDGSYDNIFESVSFQLDTDWKLGFTGRNGRGKTTFLKLLLGKYEYSGSISSSCRFEYFPYDIKNPAQTTAEIENGICPDCLQWEITREFSLLELDEEVLCRPFASLSSGEQTKAMLAGMFLRENAFLLIDEPTNHLDLRGREIVSRYLKSKKGFILVSHDRAFLDGCVDHILSINKTNIDIQRGNFSSWLLDKERRDSSQLSENEKLQKEISQLSAAAKRTSAWSDKAEKAKYDTKNSGLRADRGYVGHKAAKMMKRSKAIETRRKAAAEEKTKLLGGIENSEALKLTRLSYHTNRLVLLDGVTIRYGEKTACRDVSFTIERGDRAALCGKNGSGKSSILKLICGEALDYSGNFQKGSRLLVSYVPQNTSNLSGSLADYARQNEIDESLLKAILRKLDFSRVQLEKDMRNFSGGQKKKALIARSLCEQAHLLVWDEPLNFIDVISRMQIEELILEYKPTILFVEHDSAFCENVATRKIQLP